MEVLSFIWLNGTYRLLVIVTCLIEVASFLDVIGWKKNSWMWLDGSDKLPLFEYIEIINLL